VAAFFRPNCISPTTQVFISAPLKRHWAQTTQIRTSSKTLCKSDVIHSFVSPNPLILVLEIKDYRGEDAKANKEAVQVRWLPGVNALGSHGTWAFAEFTEVYAMQEDFGRETETAFNGLITTSTPKGSQT
jgi:hypothetical protein